MLVYSDSSWQFKSVTVDPHCMCRNLDQIDSGRICCLSVLLCAYVGILTFRVWRSFNQKV